MSKEILLLGEFSTGKSAFINMILGVSILPERLESTDMPIIKIHGGSPAGVWLREPNQKNLRGLDKFSEIPKDWTLFEYAEITIPTHPLLKEGLIFWDTPGINSTNPQHQKHLENYLQNNHRNFAIIYYFLHSNVTATSINFLKKLTKYFNKLNILINIKEVKPELECRLIEKEVKKEIKTQISNIPIDLLYVGDINEEFNTLSEDRRKNLTEWELIKDWDKRKIDISGLRNRYKNNLIGDEILDVITEIANKKNVDENYYYKLDIENLKVLADSGDPKAQYVLSIRYSLVEGYFNIAFDYLKLAANNGSGEAQYDLSTHYKTGLICETNNELYIQYLQMAVINNEPEAIAEQYFEGINTLKNPEVGFSILKNAVDNGNYSIYSSLAECYKEGKGIEKDLIKAEYHYRSSVEFENQIFPISLISFLLEHPDKIKLNEGVDLLLKYSRENFFFAKLLLALYYRDNPDNNNVNKVFSLLSPFEGRNYWADFILANCYGEGQGVAKNENKKFQLLKNIYDEGFTIGINALAECYSQGCGIKKNDQEAIRLYKISSEKGNLDAKYILASKLTNYEGSFEEGMRLYKELADLNIPNALIDLGVILSESNPKEALKYLLRVADSNNSTVHYLLGKIYLEDDELDTNKQKAFGLLTKAANQGVSDAQHMLGLCFLNGWGIKKNQDKAFEWIKKATEQDLVIAQCSMGYLYLKGIGTKENLSECIKWYKKASEQGHHIAQYYLATFYLNGDVVNKNEQEAFRLFKLSAEQDDYDAQNMLGRFYSEGWGVYKDDKAAFKYFESAADHGNMIAQFNLAERYFNGTGCSKDLTLAFKYFMASAEQGYSDSQYCLGYIYENGLGVISDVNQAWFWYEKAADQGNENAINAINELNRQINGVRR